MSKSKEKEVWKEITNYPNYEVSTTGLIRSLNYRNTGKTQILKHRFGKRGYAYLNLYNEFGKRTVTVHRMVLETFVYNNDPTLVCDHIDCNKRNNKLSNLRWLSFDENCQRSPANTLNYEKAKQIRDLYKTGTYTHAQLGVMYKVRTGTITKVLNNQRWI
jgi:hypothetical protein